MARRGSSRSTALTSLLDRRTAPTPGTAPGAGEVEPQPARAFDRAEPGRPQSRPARRGTPVCTDVRRRVRPGDRQPAVGVDARRATSAPSSCARSPRVALVPRCSPAARRPGSSRDLDRAPFDSSIRPGVGRPGRRPRRRTACGRGPARSRRPRRAVVGASPAASRCRRQLTIAGHSRWPGLVAEELTACRRGVRARPR